MTPRHGLVAAALVFGCASQSASRPAVRALDRMLASPAAREVAREAPEAYAEAVAAAAEARAQGTDAAALDARLVFEYAQARASLAASRRRTEAAERERVAVERDASRAEQEAAELTEETERRMAARRTAERARRAATAPTTVPSAERAAAAAEARQEASLLVAAAVMLGATDAQCRPVRDRIDAAQRVSAGDANAALAAAGAALLAAERLLQSTRDGAQTASVSDGAEIATSLSMAGGFEPRRDARGVVAVLRGLFEGPRLAATSRTRVETLARVIRGQEGARVRIEVFVGGPARAPAETLAATRAVAVRDALVRAGVPNERLQAQGMYRLAGASRSDDRVEVVLVLPGDP